MKSALLTLVLFSNLSFAGDLESELAKQTVTQISPVTFKGLPVCQQVDRNSRPGDEYAPSLICSMLGYPRLVSHAGKYKSLELSTRFANPNLSGFHGSPSMYEELSKGSSEYYCIEEVVCAR